MQSTDSRTITLAGTEYSIPYFPTKTLRIVTEPCLRAIASIRANSAASAETIDDMNLCIFEGIRSALPDFTQEQYDALRVKVPELIRALAVIAEQTGLMTRDGSDKPGEPLTQQK